VHGFTYYEQAQTGEKMRNDIGGAGIYIVVFYIEK